MCKLIFRLPKTVLLSYTAYMKNAVLRCLRFAKTAAFASLFIFPVVLFTACDSSHQHGQKDGNVNPSQWVAVDEPSLGFRAKFPGKWKSDIKFMGTDRGMAPVYIFEYWHIAFQYGITIVRLPDGVANRSTSTKALDNAVKALAQEQNAVISYQESFMIGGYPARRAVLSLPDSYLKNARVNTMIILRDNLVYRVTTAGIGNLEYVDFFLKSFELTPIRQ